MKKAFLILLIVTLAILSAPLFAAGGTEPTKVEEKAMAATGELQYGGTMTIFTARHNADPPGPDMKDAFRDSFHWLDFVLQKPIVGDYEKYGPIGGNVYNFQLLGAIPDQYQKGLLLDSWDVSFEKMVWRVKPGIKWAPTSIQSAWMTPRELTADDIVKDIKEFVLSAYTRRFDGILTVDGVKLIDKYTLEIYFDKRFSADLFYFIGYEDRAVVSAPEMAAVPGRAAKWENQVSTGPWQFDEYVVGSHFAVKKNPNYWDTTVVNGKEYKMPFIDRVVLPIIPDPTTRLAALKTGKTDLAIDVPAEQWSTLDKGTPDLIMGNIAGGNNTRIALRCDIPPFNNVNVRRALMIGTDLKQQQMVWMAGGMPIQFYPIYPGAPSYTPIEKLPADIAILYKYDPALAKKMLADAGYPNGFSIEFNTTSASPKAMDLASLCADQWSKIGVTVTIVTRDSVEHNRAKYSHPPIWSGALYDNLLEASPTRMYTMYHKSGVDLNYNEYKNARLDALCELMEKELDVNKREAYIKEAGEIVLREVPGIPASIVPQRIYWWPWIKNYYGSYTIQDDCNTSEMVPYMWIDKDLKAKMGY